MSSPRSCCPYHKTLRRNCRHASGSGYTSSTHRGGVRREKSVPNDEPRAMTVCQKKSHFTNTNSTANINANNYDTPHNRTARQENTYGYRTPVGQHIQPTSGFGNPSTSFTSETNQSINQNNIQSANLPFGDHNSLTFGITHQHPAPAGKAASFTSLTNSSRSIEQPGPATNFGINQQQQNMIGACPSIETAKNLSISEQLRHLARFGPPRDQSFVEKQQNNGNVSSDMNNAALNLSGELVPDPFNIRGICRQPLNPFEQNSSQFGQSNQLNQSNFNSFGQPNQTAFGQTNYANVFGQSNQSTGQINSFGQANQNTNSFSQGGPFSNRPTATPFETCQPQSFQFGICPQQQQGSNFSQIGQPYENNTQCNIPPTGDEPMEYDDIFETNINPNYQSITAFQNGQENSFEELRWEDYQNNRKGPQQFGQPWNQFGQLLPQFGQPVPQYGQQLPQFGQPLPQFGQPVPQYGQPLPQFGQPVPQFEQLLPQFGQPLPQFGQPVPEYGQQFVQPLPNFGQPLPQFGQPLPQFGQPLPQYGQQLPQFGQPLAESYQQLPHFGRPLLQFGQTLPQFGQSLPVYGQPLPQFGYPAEAQTFPFGINQQQQCYGANQIQQFGGYHYNTQNHPATFYPDCGITQKFEAPPTNYLHAVPVWLVPTKETNLQNIMPYEEKQRVVFKDLLEQASRFNDSPLQANLRPGKEPISKLETITEMREEIFPCRNISPSPSSFSKEYRRIDRKLTPPPKYLSAFSILDKDSRTERGHTAFGGSLLSYSSVPSIANPKLNIFASKIDADTHEINFTIRSTAKRLMLTKKPKSIFSDKTEVNKALEISKPSEKILPKEATASCTSILKLSQPNSIENNFPVSHIDERETVNLFGYQKMNNLTTIEEDSDCSSNGSSSCCYFSSSSTEDEPTPQELYNIPPLNLKKLDRYSSDSSSSECTCCWNLSPAPTEDSSTETISCGNIEQLVVRNIRIPPLDLSTIIEKEYTSDSSGTGDTFVTTKTTLSQMDSYELENPPKRPNIDTCGITLTHPDYYIIPNFEELVLHKTPDGSCYVRGFTIGRIGYGNVAFTDSINVANLNLDELVHFRYRELTIYPVETNKPPVGQGLNRPAQVTLDNIYPKDMTTKQLIKDTKTLIDINFIGTLKRACKKAGSKFLQYRYNTGSWVFFVNHFSTFKFVNDSKYKLSKDIQNQNTVATSMTQLKLND